MDETRVEELRRALLDALQQRTKVLCTLAGVWDVQHQRQVFQVGHDQAVIELRMGTVRSPAWKLSVRSASTHPKTFRENAAGWFPLPHVAKYMIEILEDEAKRRQEEARQRQLYRSAENAIQRVVKTLPLLEGIGLVPSTLTPGGLDIVVAGLTEDQAKKLLRLARDLKGAPENAQDGLWAHLRADDD